MENYCMVDDDGCAEIDESYRRAKRTCEVIRVALLVATVIVSILGCAIVLGLIYFHQYFVASYIAVYGALIVASLWNLVKLFSEVDKEGPLFYEYQDERLKRVAQAALALTVIELAFTAGYSYLAVPNLGYGIVINDGVTEPTINLNIGMLVFSAIMYSLSVIFRYAALLQQLSDDTV